MIQIVYNFYPSHFTNGRIRLSELPNNNFTIQNDVITMKKFPNVTDERNTCGDGVDGNVNQPLSIIQLNSSVSRKQFSSSPQTIEGVHIPDLMESFFANKPDDQIVVEYKEVTEGKPDDWDTNYMNYYTDEDGDGNYERVEQVTSIPEWDESKTYYTREETPITPPTPTPTSWDEILGADIPNETWNEHWAEYYTRSGEYPDYVYTPVAPGIPVKDNEETYYTPHVEASSESEGGDDT